MNESRERQDNALSPQVQVFSLSPEFHGFFFGGKMPGQKNRRAARKPVILHISHDGSQMCFKLICVAFDYESQKLAAMARWRRWSSGLSR